MIDLLILILASWRLSNMILYEDGPGDIFLRFRESIGIFYELDKDGNYELNIPKKNFFSALLSCMQCSTIWAGIFFTIFYTFFQQATILIAFPFALSAGALLIDKFIDGG